MFKPLKFNCILFYQANCLPPECYCPITGEDCEQLRYSVPMHSLVNINKHIGNHNRNYFFTIKVTNNANLFTTEDMVILVDESPPETGVVLEGTNIYQLVWSLKPSQHC